MNYKFLKKRIKEISALRGVEEPAEGTRDNTDIVNGAGEKVRRNPATFNTSPKHQP